MTMTLRVANSWPTVDRKNSDRNLNKGLTRVATARLLHSIPRRMSASEFAFKLWLNTSRGSRAFHCAGRQATQQEQSYGQRQSEMVR